MPILLQLDLAWSDLGKALGPDVSVKTPTPGGGQQGGPGGSPRPGHKYIKREWAGDHWEYEYAEDPHAEHHGLGHVGQEQHTLDIHPTVDASGMTPEQAYNASRKAQLGAHMAGMVFPGKHPKTGEPIEFHVAAIKDPESPSAQRLTPHGVKIWVKMPGAKKAPKVQLQEVGHNAYTTNVGGTDYHVTQRESGEWEWRRGGEPPDDLFASKKDAVDALQAFVNEAHGTAGKKGSPYISELTGKKQPFISSWAGVERFYRFEKDSYEVNGPDGTPYYKVGPNIGKVDVANDVLVPTKDPRRIRIAFLEGSPEYIKGDPHNGVYAKDEADAKRILNLMETNRSKVSETESGERPPISQMMSEGVTPIDILNSGKIPYERDLEKRAGGSLRLKAKFESPEQKHQFLSYLAGVVFPQTYQRALEITNNPKLEPRRSEIIAKLTGMGTDIGKEMARSGKLESGTHATPLDPATFNLENTDTPLYRYLENAVDGSFDPSKGALADHAFQSLRPRFASWAFENGYWDERDLKEAMGSDPGAEDYASADVLGGGMSTPEVRLRGEEGSEISDWRDTQNSKIDQWAEMDPSFAQFADQAKQAINGVENAEHVGMFIENMNRLANHLYGDNPQARSQFVDDIIHDLEKAIKSLTAILMKHLAIKAIIADVTNGIIKAKVGQPQLNHAYSHREGSNDHPIFYWTDERGNYYRYTNAPEGHPDYSPYAGPPSPYPTEPLSGEGAKFYTPDGRKLTRAPFTGRDVEWNTNYHPNDPKNLWAGRWVNPVTGEHEYTYVDSDLRQQQKLQVHRQNAVVDVRIPYLRRYTTQLLHSPQPKDVIVGLMLVLVDQGRMHPVELSRLTVADVQLNGDIIRFGRFAVHAGEKIQQITAKLLAGKESSNPVFAVPMVTSDPASQIGVGVQYRQIGPHFIMRLLERLGTPLYALQSYHATQTYSLQIQRCLSEGGEISLDGGHYFALLEVAKRMGYDFSQVPDVNTALQVISQKLIDPIVVEVIAQNARTMNLGQGSMLLQRPLTAALPHVSANLQDRTNSEKEFSRWLHIYPVHEHAEVRYANQAA